MHRKVRKVIKFLHDSARCTVKLGFVGIDLRCAAHIKDLNNKIPLQCILKVSPVQNAGFRQLINRRTWKVPCSLRQTGNLHMKLHQSART